MTADVQTAAPDGPGDAERFSAFAPPSLVRELRARGARSTLLGETFEAAVLFADISGFTSLAARMGERGAAGTEELTRHLNGCFGAMLRLVDDAGGHVEKFAGDALLAVFRLHEGEADAAAATLRAASAALAIVAEIRSRRTDEVPLGAHAGVGVGTVTTHHVETTASSRAFVLAGEPLGQAAAANGAAVDGEVCVSVEAAALGGRALDLADEAAPGGPRRVRRVDLPTSRPTSPADVTTSAPPGLQRYLNRALTERLARGGDLAWIAELRRTSVVFVSMAPVDDEPLAADALVAVARVLGDHVARFDGLLFDFLTDDKGLVAILLFGVHNAHEDDAARALHAALALDGALRAAGTSPKIGVATGRVYCGVVGSDARKELAVVGDAMNLAARLMGAAKHGVLAAPSTAADAGDRFEFEEVRGLALKNVSSDFVAVRPLEKAARRTAPRRATTVVGRRAEWTRLSNQLTSHVDRPDFAAVVLEGEAGIGKSALVRAFEEAAARAGVRVLHVGGDAIEQVSPYHAWRDAAAALLGVDLTATAATQRESLAATMGSLAEHEGTAPLLGAFVPHAPAETARTLGLEPQARAEQTRDVMLSLLRRACAERPVALVVEDAHWLDSASWALVHQIGARRLPLLLLETTRPTSGEIAAERAAFTELAGVSTLTLGPLGAAASAELVAAKLGVQRLSPGVESLIFERAAGHPFFTEELTLALRDAGALRIADDECMLASSDRQRAALAVPDTLERVITSRIDRLREPERLALKVASVLGREVSTIMLEAIHPGGAHEVTDLLATLCERELLEEVDDGLLRFKHALTQEVGYSLLPFAQRRELHRAVAQQLEAHDESRDTTTDDAAAHLSHHWGLAEAPERALPHAERAASGALRRFANREAVHFFREALRFHRAAGVDVAAARVATWESDLGRALRALGEITTAKQHCESALARLDHPVHSRSARARVGLGAQMLRMLLARPRVSPSDRPDAAAVAAVNAYMQLVTISHYENDIEAMMFSTAYAAAAARRVGATIEVATLYGSVAHMAAFAKVFSASRAYAKGAHAIADIVRSVHCTGTVNQYTGHLAGCLGDLETMDRDMHRARDAYAELGPGRPFEEALTNLGYLYQFRGDLPRALETMQALERSGRARDDAQTTGWGIVGQGRVLLAQGELEAARRRLDAAEPSVTDSLTLSELHGNRALAHYRLGELGPALEDAARALVVAEKTPSTSYTTLPGYSAIMEVFTLACLGGHAGRLVSAGGVSRVSARVLATRMLAAFDRYAKLFPIAEPQRDLWAGVMKAVNGQPREAAKAWGRASQRAARSPVRDDAACALRWTARARSGDARRAVLADVATRFDELGRRYEADEARAALAGERRSNATAPWEGAA